MKSASIYGSPKCCCNTNCKTPFTKKSFLGWSPKHEIEVYTIMKCSKCNSLFKVAQSMMEAYQYYEKLPEEKKVIIPKTKITKEEALNVKKTLEENNNLLNELNEGMIPGLSKSLKPKIDE